MSIIPGNDPIARTLNEVMKNAAIAAHSTYGAGTEWADTAEGQQLLQDINLHILQDAIYAAAVDELAREVADDDITLLQAVQEATRQGYAIVTTYRP